MTTTTTLSERYLRCFEKTMGIEGLYSNDPDDPGGETMYGIARNYWSQYWANGRPTRATARQFYWDQFWLKIKGDDIADEQVAFEIFDTAVNVGLDRAVKIAQNVAIVVGGAMIDDDGNLGRLSLAALNACCTPALVKRTLNYLNGAQLGLYIERWERTPTKRKYKGGWRNRCRAEG